MKKYLERMADTCGYFLDKNFHGLSNRELDPNNLILCKEELNRLAKAKSGYLTQASAGLAANLVNGIVMAKSFFLAAASAGWALGYAHEGDWQSANPAFFVGLGSSGACALSAGLFVIYNRFNRVSLKKWMTLNEKIADYYSEK